MNITLGTNALLLIDYLQSITKKHNMTVNLTFATDTSPTIDFDVLVNSNVNPHIVNILARGVGITFDKKVLCREQIICTLYDDANDNTHTLTYVTTTQTFDIANLNANELNCGDNDYDALNAYMHDDPHFYYECNTTIIKGFDSTTTKCKSPINAIKVFGDYVCNFISEPPYEPQYD